MKKAAGAEGSGSWRETP